MKLAALIAAIGMVSTSSSSAATKACFTDSEFADVLVVFAPVALQAMGQQCAAVLTKGLVLGNPSSDMARQLNAASAETWPRIWPTMLQVLTSNGVPAPAEGVSMTRSQFGEASRPFLSKIISKPASCAPADRMLSLAEPLPIKNLSQLVVEIFHLMPSGRGVQFLCTKQ